MVLVASSRMLLLCALVAASLLGTPTDATLRGAHGDARRQLGQEEEVSVVRPLWLWLPMPFMRVVPDTVA